MKNVLDHGFVELLDSMGDDLSIVSAARISYDRDASQFPEECNRELLEFLIKEGHTSPLEMVEFKFRIHAPVIVWWQFVRHRMAEYNARSGRYTPYLEDEFYVPKKFRRPHGTNKQASVECDAIDHDFWHNKLVEHYTACFMLYSDMLDAGIAREIARLALPGFALYHTFIVKMNAHSLMNFLKKRCDGHAQYEIRQYAFVMNDFFKDLCPWTYEFCKKYGRL